MKAKFRCAVCWETDDTEYMIRQGLDLSKPLEPLIDYTKNDTVIIEGNLLCLKTKTIDKHTVSRYGRGFQCDECDFDAGLGLREYNQGEFRCSPAPRRFRLGAPDPTENMHCAECGRDRRHISAYDDVIFCYYYICTECLYTQS